MNTTSTTVPAKGAPSIATDLPRLFVKTGCPYCRDAEKFLSEHGISFREINVIDDAQSFVETEKLSGQTKAPAARRRMADRKCGREAGALLSPAHTASASRSGGSCEIFRPLSAISRRTRRAAHAQARRCG
jgi:hypothetical protein